MSIIQQCHYSEQFKLVYECTFHHKYIIITVYWRYKLQEIGCDLELRTGKRLDKCGKCGGNGSSCSKSSVHSWIQLPISSCSMSCGGGMAMVQHQCVDITTNQTIAEEFCDPSLKPKELFAKCNENKCPPR